MKNRILTTIVSILLSVSSFSQNDYGVLFNEKKIQPPLEFDELEILENYKLGDKSLVLIQFHKIPNAEDIIQMKNAGITLFDHYPKFAYSAIITQPTAAQFPLIRSIFVFKPDEKVSKLLLDENFLPEHIKHGNKIEIVINYHPGVKFSEIEEIFRENNSQITQLDEYASFVKIKTTFPEIHFWANQIWSMYIEPAFGPDEPENYEGRASHRSNYVFQEFEGGNKYDGSGVWISLNDDGPISEHIDFKGRIDESQTGNNNGTHGDHCAGTLMGAGNLVQNNRGAAFGADLKVYNVYGAFDNIYNDAANLGLVITSTSYGDGCNTGYTGFSRTLDIQTRLLPNLTHVFSAGNSGQDNCNYGAGVGWGVITGGHKVAKNSLVVGSITKTDQLSPFSSRGPTRDGRIKPDVVAVGSSVLSTIGTPANTYAVFSGTSMACPAVAGLMAQLYQAYRETHQKDPLSHTARAILLNSCDDLGNPGPDFSFGYGRVNGRRSLNTITEGRFLVDSVQNEQIKTYNIEVSAGLSEFRVMLSWNDREAPAGSQAPLINDLDLKVIAPNGQEYLPWILDPTPNVIALTSNAVRGEDHLNLNEQITIENPIPGTYQIVVSGFYIALSNFTAYTVTHEFVKDEVVITFPNGGESLTPGQQITMRWDSYGSTGSFDLSFSNNDGVDWFPIFNNVNASQRHFNWTVPNIVTGKMKLRIKRGNIESISQKINVINAPTGLAVSNACPDQLQISWSAVNGATKYVIYKLGSKYMEPIDTVSALNYVFQNLDLTQEIWVSVSALGINDAIGRRANAIQIVPNTDDCPVALDLALTHSVFPYQGLIPLCIFENIQPLKLAYKNQGELPFNQDVEFQAYLNGQPFSNLILSSNNIAAPGQTATIEFPETINLNSLIGVNELKFYIQATNDLLAANDTIIVQFEVLQNTTQDLPIFQDFETFDLNSSASNCENEIQPLGNGWINLSNHWADDIDWRVFAGQTPTTSTGPNTDFSEGTTAGKYIYLEANSCFSRRAELYSPCINLSNVEVPILSYAYHMFGINMGSLSVDILTENGWHNIDFLEGNQGNNWFNPEFNLQDFTGGNAIIRFTGIIGNGVRSDLSLDAIGIKNFAEKPQAAFELSASYICTNSQIQLINNSVGYAHSYHWIVSPSNGFQFVNGTNANSAEPQLQFNTPGEYSIMLIASNANGSDTLNMNAAIQVGIGQQYPIFENFENVNLQQGWTRSESFNGERWNRTVAITGSNGQPTHAMSINNFNFALITDSHYIQTQPIKISNALFPELTFDLAYSPRNTTFRDGLLIQISTDCGNTFENVYLKRGLELATTDFSVNQFVPFEASHWRKDTLNLSNYIGQTIVIRFVNINQFGNNIYLDNINISEQGVKAILSAQNTCVNEQVIFSSNSIGSIDTFEWDFGADAAPSSAIGEGPHTVVYSTTGLKQVTLSVTGVNGSDSQTFNVIIEEVPQADFSFTTNGLIVNFETHQNALSYLWDFGDGNTSNVQNPTHQYSFAGNYNVVLTLENECAKASSSTVVIIDPVGVALVEEKLKINIFPNPGFDKMFIEISNTNHDFWIEMVNISGKSVIQQKYASGTTLVEISTQNLPAGVYLVKLFNKDFKEVLRWIKVAD